MNDKEKILVKTGITYGLALAELIKYVVDGCANNKNLKYWRTKVNKYNKILNKNVSAILNNKKEED